MVIFNSYVKLPEGIHHCHHFPQFHHSVCDAEEKRNVKWSEPWPRQAAELADNPAVGLPSRFFNFYINKYDNNDNIYISIYIHVYVIYISIYYVLQDLIISSQTNDPFAGQPADLPRWRTLWVGFQSQECLRAQQTLRPRCQAVSKSQAPEKWWTIFYHFFDGWC